MWRAQTQTAIVLTCKALQGHTDEVTLKRYNRLHLNWIVHFETDYSWPATMVITSVFFPRRRGKPLPKERTFEHLTSLIALGISVQVYHVEKGSLIASHEPSGVWIIDYSWSAGRSRICVEWAIDYSFSVRERASNVRKHTPVSWGKPRSTNRSDADFSI